MKKYNAQMYVNFFIAFSSLFFYIYFLSNIIEIDKMDKKVLLFLFIPILIILCATWLGQIVSKIEDWFAFILFLVIIWVVALGISYAIAIGTILMGIQY